VPRVHLHLQINSEQKNKWSKTRDIRKENCILRASENTYESEHALAFLSVLDIAQCQTAVQILYRARLVGLLSAT